jgi:dTDP-4-dehydrorhamnose reductase
MRTPGIVVLGGTGMLGHKMFQILRERFPGTLTTARQTSFRPPLDRLELLQGPGVLRGIDVTDFTHLEGFLADLKPDWILNCVGIIKQRDEAHMAIPSITINSLLPHKLSTFAAAWGGRVIHFSTDCVFSGKRGRYTEDDLSDAEDLYGKTKFLGEIHTENALTLRTSMIGREIAGHKSLLDWFLAQKGKTIQGFRRVIYSGLTTLELVEVVTLILKKFSNLSGLYQVVSEPISKYDLLCLLRDAYDIEVEITPNETEVSDRSMKGDRFRAVTGYKAPAWPELVRNLADDPTSYDLF